jgi:hypothetical protein
MRIISKTKLSDNVVSYGVEIGAEELNEEETPADRYQRHLNQLLHDIEETEENDSQSVHSYSAKAIYDEPSV